MKEKATFTIDDSVLNMARNSIPNMSQFVEDCFKAYLSFTTENDEDRGEELRQAWEDFHKAKLNIHLLTEVNYEEKDIEKALAEQKNNAWLNVWADYRRTGTVSDKKLEQSSKTLQTETDILKQTLADTLFEAKEDMTKLYIYDNWKYVEENILPHVELEDEEEFDLNAL